MKAKILVYTLPALILATIHLADAQQAGNIPRIGFLSQAAPPAPNLEEFRQGLRERGYVEGKNIVIEYLNAEGKPDRFLYLASDLLRLQINGMLLLLRDATFAAKNAATVIL